MKIYKVKNKNRKIKRISDLKQENTNNLSKNGKIYSIWVFIESENDLMHLQIETSM